jgi:2-amino-4-hydroxy-6-hydroxymethyldihydropteridine diphosphokinase
MYLQRKLTDKLQTFQGLRYPFTSKTKSKFRYSATIGIGGNIGDVKRRFEHLFYFLKKEKLVCVEKTSLILKNPPFGYLNQEDFLNSIIILRTNLNAKELLMYLLRVEKKFGRKRSFADAPRTLDLDIIFFNNQVINTKNLIIPHVDWSNRESVIIPLVSMKK